MRSLEAISSTFSSRRSRKGPENGYIFLHEALLNDDGNGPLGAALFSFLMFIKSI